MVDFTLTDEQKDLRELAHDFAERRRSAPSRGSSTATAAGRRRSSTRRTRSGS